MGEYAARRERKVGFYYKSVKCELFRTRVHCRTRRVSLEC